MEGMDSRDFGTIMAERDKVKEELEQSRDRFREADKQARKVPALVSEVNRLNKVEENLREDLHAASEQQGDLSEELTSVKTQLRSQEEVSKEAQQAQADRADALAEQEAAEDALSAAQAHINELEGDLEEAKKEIERLQAHEKATGKFKDALDALKTV